MGTITAYRMNPKEDEILFGTQLKEGMWVLCEFSPMRSPHGSDEDSQIRQQCFRQVTGLSTSGDQVVFIGKWIDGYAEVHKYHATFYGWLVKRDPITSPDAMFRAITEGEPETNPA
jgi:hypothetical protein